MALTDKLTAIADAIRAKTGGTGKLTLEQMASKINAFSLYVGDPVGILDVGSSVWMKVGGVRKEFIIVHQGLPSKTWYDTSCHGTWLLMKDIYEQRIWDSTNNDYANSDIHSYLSNTFLNLFDSGIQGVIKQVKIPYRQGSGTSTTISYGANGLSTKVFLLSRTEVGETGGTGSYSPTNDGAALDYFNDAEASKRIAYFNGTATMWGTRTIGTKQSTHIHAVLSSGEVSYQLVTYDFGVRPALILPLSTPVDKNFNVIA